MKTFKTLLKTKQNVALTAISILLFVVFYILTNSHGLAISPDSSSYLQVANSLLNGEGFYNKIGGFVKHWPPLYPISIAFIAKLTFTNVETAGLILNGLTIVISYIFGFKILKQLHLNFIFCYITPLLMVVSKAFTLSAFMLSESLFIAFEIMALFYYLKWVNLKNYKYLLVFSVLCGALVLTRYAGVGIILGFLIFELFFNSKSVIKGIKHCIIIGLPVLIGIAFWFTYIKLNSDSTEVRKIGVHVLSLSKFLSIFKNIGLWFINKSSSVFLGYLMFFGSFIYYYKQIKLNFNIVFKRLKFQKKPLTLFLLLSLTYLGFLLISMLFFDRETPGSNRILSLIFPFLLFIITILFDELFKTELRKTVYIGLAALLIGILSNSSPIWKKHFTEGLLYSNKSWKSSEITVLLNKTNKYNTYSNAPDFLNYKTKTLHYYLPFKITAVDTINTNYHLELEKLKTSLKDSSYIAIYFDNINRTSTTPKSILKEELKEFPITYFTDGFIIGHILKK